MTTHDKTLKDKKRHDKTTTRQDNNKTKTKPTKQDKKRRNNYKTRQD